MPDTPDAVVDTYLCAVDARLPGLVTGAYGYGSLTLGDWRPGISDVDLLVVTARELTDADLDALAQTHAALPPGPDLDIVYAPAAWLTADELPDDERPTPYHLGGTLHRDAPCGQLTPVLWLSVTRHGRVFRGEPLTVPVDPERLRRYNIDNLRSYWQRESGWPAALLGDADPAQVIPADPVVWLTLGPPRLHHTLTTGDIIGKTAAGEYLAREFPAYAELAGRAVNHRAGRPVTFTAADALTAGAAATAVISDATRRWG